MGVMAAHGELLKAMPAELTAPALTPAVAVAGRIPTTADPVTVQARELGIVQKLLDSGQVLEEVVRGASPDRLAAIAANAEVLPEVIRSDDPASAVKGIHKQMFDALMATNTEPVVNADTAMAVAKLDKTFGIGQPQVVR